MHVLAKPCLTIISSIGTVLCLLYFHTLISVNFTHLVTHFRHRSVPFMASCPGNDSSHLSYRRSTRRSRCNERIKKMQRKFIQPMKLFVSNNFRNLRQDSKLPRNLLAGIFPLFFELIYFSVFNDNYFREIFDHCYRTFLLFQLQLRSGQLPADSSTHLSCSSSPSQIVM